MAILAPSILSADFSRLGSQIASVEEAGAEYLHIDVMDGVFVPNITIGPAVVKSVRDNSKMTFDVHLMITDPEKHIGAFAEAGADIICFHYEATGDALKTAKLINKSGIKSAVSIKPKTDESAVKGILDAVDMVLVMSVEPGYGGQELINETLGKAERLAAYISRNNLKTLLEIDGGINLTNVRSALNAGVNVIVAGSAVFQNPDPGEEVKKFRKIFGEYK